MSRPGPARHQGIIDTIRILRIELRIANDRIAAAAGLNPRDLDILDVIDRDAPCTPGHLAARTGIPPATLTGVLTRLEAGDWIARTPDRHDARSTRITATARFGELRALYADGDALAADLIDRLPAGTRKDIEGFLLSLAGLIHAAQDR